MEHGAKGKGLLEYLREVPDPRRRQGRIYPLAGILVMLILAALQGESTLRGMWVWAKEREQELVDIEVLGFWGVGRIPTLSAIWYTLKGLDVQALEEVLGRWAAEWGYTKVIAVDGKVLRGSKRESGEALQVVTAVAQVVRVMLRQRGVSQGDMVHAAVALLEGLPLEGKVVSLDAGLMQRSVVETVVKKGGPTLGC